MAAEDGPTTGDLLFGGAASSSGEAGPVAGVNAPRRQRGPRRSTGPSSANRRSGLPTSTPRSSPSSAATQQARCEARRPTAGRGPDSGASMTTSASGRGLIASLHALHRSQQRDLLGARIGQLLTATQQSANLKG
eukprot:5704964-Pyramimonas_sp.AAC.1